MSNEWPAITSTERGLFVFLLDQSGSMDNEWSSGNKKKDQLAEIVNKILYKLVAKGKKGSVYKDRFDAILVGYGDSPRPVLATPLSGEEFVSSKAIFDAHGDSETAPAYVVAEANGGGTDMYSAFTHIEKLIADWVISNKESAPPSIFHITDGENTGQDPIGAVQRIQSLSTNYGGCLVWNIHISSAKNGSNELFLETPDSLKEDSAKFLFGISSVLPNNSKFGEHGGKRAFGYNLDPDALLRVLEIGTRE